MRRIKSKKDIAERWLRQREKDKSKKVETFVDGKRIPFNRIFVPVYDYKTNRRKLSYLVSDSGEVLSFKSGKAKFLTLFMKNDRRYCHIENTDLPINRLVWFSFARQWVKDKSVPAPKAFTEITTVDQLKEYSVAMADQGIKYQIHHGDGNPTNDKYTNLVLEDNMHDILSSADGAVAAARKNGIEEGKAILAMVDAVSRKKNVSTAIHLSDKVTRTRDFNLSDGDFENITQGMGLKAYDTARAKEILKAAYFEKFPDGTEKPVDCLYKIDGIPQYRSITYKNGRLYISKLKYSSKVRISLGDIAGDILVETITDQEQIIDRIKDEELRLAVITETRGKLNAATLVAGKVEA